MVTKPKKTQMRNDFDISVFSWLASKAATFMITPGIVIKASEKVLKNNKL